MCCRITQGYGLTESTAGATTMDGGLKDQSNGLILSFPVRTRVNSITFTPLQHMMHHLAVWAVQLHHATFVCAIGRKLVTG